MKRIIIPALLAVLSSSGAIAIENPSANDKELIEKYIPKLSIEYVIKEAKEYAQKKENNFKNYYINGVKYEPSTKEWLISFMFKGVPRPGDHFSVWINDRTKEKRLLEGF